MSAAVLTKKAKAPTREEMQAEIDRWCEEPLYWAKRFGGEDFDPWSGQEELWFQYGKLLNAKLARYQGLDLTPEQAELADKHGISIMAGHGMGKERSVALIGLHYHFVLKCYQPKGVCTAPAGPTLQSTLWPEFGKVIAGSETLCALFEKQSNRIFLKEDKKRGEFMRIEPRTIQQNSNPDEQGVVLAGIHATGVIYLITEASGVQDPVFKPIEGGLTDPLSMVIMIFNPTRRDGFAALSHTTNRKNWICLQWDGRQLKKEKLANPGRFLWYNERAQDALIEKYGEDSDTVRIRVRGLPPKQSADTLIHYDSALAAVARQVETLPADPLVIAVDVAGEDGGDKSIVLVMRGPKVMSITEYQDKNTVQLGDVVAAKLKSELMALPEGCQFAVIVDTIGIGRGVYNHLVDVQHCRNVYKMDVSESPLDEKQYHRMRDQVGWELREAFMEAREIAIPDDDELISQVTTIKWAEVNGKIKIQGKGSSSGIPNVKPLASSPDKYDALGMAWWAYKHHTSRLPGGTRRRRRIRHRPVSWKAQ